LHPAVLAQRQPKGSGNPRAHNKPEFGPGAPVAATLRTDWGRQIPISFNPISCYAFYVLGHLTPKGALTMEWVTPQHEEIDLNCEVSSYANAEL